MKKRFLTSVLFLTMGSLVLTSCSSDNNDTTPTEPSATGKYVLLTAESTTANAGYYAAYDNLPTGAVDNIGGYSLQARAYGGFRHYKNWIFNKATLSGETGVVRFSLNASGILEQSGFIKCGTSAQNLVVDETTGFYFDADRGKTKIQKFNPTTMQRTGEIDLSELVEKGTGISTNVTTGDQTIIAKEGKETIGFIAQELEKVVPEAVIAPQDPSNEFYTVSYSIVIPVLTKAIQEQQAEIEQLKAALAVARADNAALKADVSKITALADRMQKLEASLGTNTAGNATVSK